MESTITCGPSNRTRRWTRSRSLSSPRRDRTSGAFRAFLALNAANERDYTSGLNIDLGPVAHSAVFGAQRRRPRVRRRPKPAHARIDVRPAAHAGDRVGRDRQNGPPDCRRPKRRPADRATARRSASTRSRSAHGTTTTAAGAQQPDGFGRTDIAEILHLQPRACRRTNSRSVHKYLDTKYEFVKDVLPPDPRADRRSARTRSKNPPPVQMFLPGFIGPRAAARPHEHQQRQVPRGWHARRPRLRRQNLAASRHERRRARR